MSTTTKTKTKPKARRPGLRESLRAFKRVTRDLADAGFNVAAVLSRYDDKDARFATALSLRGDEVEQDHAMLDILRELQVNWSNARHDCQLVWQEPPAKPEAKPAPARKPRAKKP